MSSPISALSALGVFAVAALYASVGHGGASGYLAVLALCGAAPEKMRASALILNLLVAAVSFHRYRAAGHFKPALFWPFAAASIPFSFLGGLVSLPSRLYAPLLAAALALAALRLMLPDVSPARPAPPGKWVCLSFGAAIGLLSGMVGVGGGVFLSPLMLLMGWADAKSVAAVSAAFIWVNSASGLLGQLGRGDAGAFALWPLAVVALAGGALGAQLGAARLSPAGLRRLLGAVLLVAVYKLA